MTATASNPLREGLDTQRITDPCTIVFFGASGDLFKRMLLPSIYELRQRGTLPTNFALVGFARSQYDDDGFRAYCKEQLDQFAYGTKPDGAMWDDFAKCIRYVTADFGDTSHFERLKGILDENDRDLKTGGNRLFYLSTPPSVFPGIIDQIQKAGLDPRSNPKGWTRIVVEKPFGTDLESARALQTEVEKVFDEGQVYRIDHYLGKEPVQDIMALRFANVIFEPIWNRNYVQSVQITAAETLGVEDRGGYYDNAGALRDMIQNHVMNLLALVAMEPPATADADAIRNEKFKVFASIQPPTLADVPKMAVRGQYDAGLIDGKPVPSYRTEPDVNPESNNETYAAVKLFVENWRWAGVPFYLRSGKRMPKRVTEIAIQFKEAPHLLFGKRGETIRPNVLSIRIQPDEGIALNFGSKLPGPAMEIAPVSMEFRYGSSFGVEPPEAYERLLLDCLLGDGTLFTRADEVEASWRWVSRIHRRWAEQVAEGRTTLDSYPAGSWGPEGAERMMAADGRAWRLP